MGLGQIALGGGVAGALATVAVPEAKAAQIALGAAKYVLPAVVPGAVSALAHKLAMVPAGFQPQVNTIDMRTPQQRAFEKFHFGS
jgi:hypothetical protein